jgi:hypothetical protein
MEELKFIVGNEGQRRKGKEGTDECTNGKETYTELPSTTIVLSIFVITLEGRPKN